MFTDVVQSGKINNNKTGNKMNFFNKKMIEQVGILYTI